MMAGGRANPRSVKVLYMETACPALSTKRYIKADYQQDDKSFQSTVSLCTEKRVSFFPQSQDELSFDLQV